MNKSNAIIVLLFVLFLVYLSEAGKLIPIKAIVMGPPLPDPPGTILGGFAGVL